jgi:predicted nuclease of predicted toxin-antitoxin system
MQPEWEIWLDNQISPIIAKWLSEQTGFKVISGYKLGLNNLSDQEIYSKAKKSGNIILISKDSDLDEIISKSGSPPKLISLKIGNCDNKVLFAILKNKLALAIRFLNDYNKDIIELQ